MTSTLSRRAHFQCVHRYVNPLWSEAENIETFGLCYNPEGHGHNYVVDVFLQGPIDPTTGMIMNLRDVDQILKAAVATLEGKHLNLEVAEFQNTVPTTENIANYLFARLKKSLPVNSVQLIRLRVYETEDLWVDCFE